MKVYRGKSDGGQKTVSVDGRPLEGMYASHPRRNVPFDWGTQPPSPGTRHLAEALLADCTGVKTALPLAHDFAAELATWRTDWDTTSQEIEKWLRLRGAIGQSVQQACWEPSTFAESTPSDLMWRLPGDFPNFPVDPLKRHRSDGLDSLRERIKPDELAKQGFPRPKEVRLSRNTDSTGEDAFYVYLVFPDKTPEEALAWDKIEPMVSWVRNLIWTETGARLWPYVKVKRQKELAGGLA